MSKRSAVKASFGSKTKEAAAQGRSIQAHVDRLEAGKKKAKSEEAMQVGQRQYPSKFPPQHLTKPGREADLKVRPMFEAPAYLGSEKLKNCAAIITGGDSGIGRAVAVLYAREGADVAIVYLDEHEDAEETKQVWKRKASAASPFPAMSPIRNSARTRSDKPSKRSASLTSWSTTPRSNSTPRWTS
jgi:short chain dehydrogenase